jgi:hypothetical protein
MSPNKHRQENKRPTNNIGAIKLNTMASKTERRKLVKTIISGHLQD